MTIERRKVSYGGRVQGVGFRMTARRLASAFPVSGYVRNREDGRVELVVEGGPGPLAAYFQSIRREFGDMILDVVEEPVPPGGESFAGFAIRH